MHTPTMVIAAYRNVFQKNLKYGNAANRSG